MNRDSPSATPRCGISPEGELNLNPEDRLPSGTAISPPSGGLGGRSSVIPFDYARKTDNLPG